MSINRDDFTTSTNDFTARLETAQDEIITFMAGETVALAKEAVKHYLAIRDNPERTGKNLKDLVDAYPGGALGLAGASLTVLKALAAKRQAAKKAAAKKGGLSVVEETELAEATDGLREAMDRHPSSGKRIVPEDLLRVPPPALQQPYAHQYPDRTARRAAMTQTRREAQRAAEQATTDTTRVALAKAKTLHEADDEMPEDMLDLPRVIHQGEWGTLWIPKTKADAVVLGLRQRISQDARALRYENDLRSQRGLEPTTGNATALAYLADLDGMLTDNTDLRTVVAMIKTLADSISVPAQEAAGRMIELLVEVSD
jgi:hypothetical protein